MFGKANLIAFIGTKDAVRAKTFYQEVLGLRLVSEDPFAIVFDANGTMLRVTPVRELRQAEYTVLGWEVSAIRMMVKKLAEKGLDFERYLGMGQDELGIWNAPSGAKVCWFKDADGNLLSMTEFR
jgi:catechol 2,3-dioxygenase-like lactoylglutathione lyase family enzyme